MIDGETDRISSYIVSNFIRCLKFCLNLDVVLVIILVSLLSVHHMKKRLTFYVFYCTKAIFEDTWTSCLYYLLAYHGITVFLCSTIIFIQLLRLLSGLFFSFHYYILPRLYYQFYFIF